MGRRPGVGSAARTLGSIAPRQTSVGSLTESGTCRRRVVGGVFSFIAIRPFCGSGQLLWLAPQRHSGSHDSGVAESPVVLCGPFAGSDCGDVRQPEHGDGGDWRPRRGYVAGKWVKRHKRHTSGDEKSILIAPPARPKECSGRRRSSGRGFGPAANDPDGPQTVCRGRLSGAQGGENTAEDRVVSMAYDTGASSCLRCKRFIASGIPSRA